jgi:hypothetical protein
VRGHKGYKDSAFLYKKKGEEGTGGSQADHSPSPPAPVQLGGRAIGPGGCLAARVRGMRLDPQMLAPSHPHRVNTIPHHHTPPAYPPTIPHHHNSCMRSESILY